MIHLKYSFTPEFTSFVKKLAVAVLSLVAMFSVGLSVKLSQTVDALKANPVTRQVVVIATPTASPSATLAPTVPFKAVVPVKPSVVVPSK